MVHRDGGPVLTLVGVLGLDVVDEVRDRLSRRPDGEAFGTVAVDQRAREVHEAGTAGARKS